MRKPLSHPLIFFHKPDWAIPSDLHPRPLPTRAAEGGARRRGAATEDDDGGFVFSSLIGAKAGALSSSAATAALRYAGGQTQAIIPLRMANMFKTPFIAADTKTTQNHV